MSPIKKYAHLDIAGVGASGSLASTRLGSSIAAAEINRELGPFIETPVRPGNKRKPARLGRICNEAQSNIKEKLRDFSFSGELPLPTSVCSSCNTLLADLSEKYPTLTTKKDKYLFLTSIPSKFGRKVVYDRVNCKEWEARFAMSLRAEKGHFSFPQYKARSTTSPEVTQMVVQFYLHPDNSLASGNETITIRNQETGEREIKSKLRILYNLVELYEAFQEHCRQLGKPPKLIGRTKFSELRPRWAQWPGQKGFHNTCVCQIHENFKFLVEHLHVDFSSTQLAELLLCDNAEPDCYLGNIIS